MKTEVIADSIKEKKSRALAGNRVLRYLSFAALYAAQGIPEGITFFAIPAWLAMNNVSALEIGTYAAVVGLPWSFKLILAPLMDRFTITSMGRKRPWVILGQLCLIMSFSSMAFIPDPLQNLNLLMTAAFFISLSGSMQDVATDGMAVDIVPAKEQARANGLMWGSKVIATATSLAIGTWVINSFGFSMAMIPPAVAITLILMVPLFIRERPGEKLLPWTSGQTSAEAKRLQLSSFRQAFTDLWKAVSLPSSLVILVVGFFLGTANGYMDTLLPIFTVQEVGWDNAQYSDSFAIASIIGGLLGMFVAGAALDLFGKKRMFQLFLIVLILLAVAMGFSSAWWEKSQVIWGFMVSIASFSVFANIALFATGMQLCWLKVSATQFTLYMTVSNLGRSAGSWLVGFLEEFVAWPYLFGTFAVLISIALIVLAGVHFKKHARQLKALDEKEPILPGVEALAV